MVEEPKQAVARTPAEWAALWRQHAGDTRAAESRFRIAHGRRGVPRHALVGRLRRRDHRAREDNGALVVEWQRAAPGARAACRRRSSPVPRMIATDAEVRRRDPVREGRAVTELARARASTPRLASVLCYAGWWVTGLVFLFAERQQPGRALPCRAIADRVRRAVGGVVPVRRRERRRLLRRRAATSRLLQAVGNALWLGAVVLWLFLLVKTWRGETWRVPVAGDLAVKIASR